MDDIFEENDSERGGKEQGNNSKEQGSVLNSVRKEGVPASAQTLKTGNRWLPGQSGNPGGRKSALRTSFQAIAAKGSPEDLAAYYWWGIESAKKQGSPRIVLQYIEFYVHMTDGTPVQRSITASGKLESILSRLGAMDDNEFAEVEQAMRGE